MHTTVTVYLEQCTIHGNHSTRVLLHGLYNSSSSRMYICIIMVVLLLESEWVVGIEHLNWISLGFCEHGEEHGYYLFSRTIHHPSVVY